MPRVGKQPPAFSSIRARSRLLVVVPLLRDLKPLLKPIDRVDPFLRLRLGDAILIAEESLLLDSFVERHRLDPIDLHKVLLFLLRHCRRRRRGYDLLDRTFLSGTVSEHEVGDRCRFLCDATNANVTATGDVDPNAVVWLELIEGVAVPRARPPRWLAVARRFDERCNACFCSGISRRRAIRIFSTSLETVIVSSLAISAAVTESISTSLGLWYLCVFTLANQRRSCFVGVVWFPVFGLRYREPQVRGNLKAGVARVARDWGSLIEHALKSNSQYSSDPLTALADGEIRER